MSGIDIENRELTWWWLVRILSNKHNDSADHCIDNINIVIILLFYLSMTFWLLECCMRNTTKHVYDLANLD